MSGEELENISESTSKKDDGNAVKKRKKQDPTKRRKIR